MNLAELSGHAKYMAAFCTVMTIVVAYISAFTAKGSGIRIDGWNTYASVSSVLTFANKKLFIGMLAVSYCFAVLAFSSLPGSQATLLIVILTMAYVLLGSLLYLPFECDCVGTKYPPCCTPTKDNDMTKAGSCTCKDATKFLPGDDVPTCCNPVSCTEKRQNAGETVHLVIAACLMALCVASVVAMYMMRRHTWSPTRKKIAIGLGVAMVLSVIVTQIINKVHPAHGPIFDFFEGALLPMYGLSFLLL